MNLSNKTLYRSLLLGAASAALASSATFAQDAGVETVVVTGSLIQHTMGDQPIPTIIVDADAIAKTGRPNIAAVLAQLPQMQTAGGGVDLTPTNSNFLTSGFGVSNVDLRQLGATRTLVLVNGRRWVTGSPTSSAVDLNTIPTQLIDRVETTTGGASAAYGSDAIAGVVNIILKQDFEGINAT
ncbi:MAG TPA: TonB-dependent receptor plug domain-containing protein, partial [Rhizomicrobium sp.]|nr:TonB-dependent receptor plug domain-containing protein [Rhizomicrobium sp.]